MTLERAVELLRELRALDRARAALALHGTDPDWVYTVNVITDRTYWLRAALSVEPPELLAKALDVLNDERRTERMESRSEIPNLERHDSHLASRRVH